MKKLILLSVLSVFAVTGSAFATETSAQNMPVQDASDAAAALKAREEASAERLKIMAEHNINNTPLKDIRFPEAAWDPELLQDIKDGPYFLDRNKTFEIPPYPANDSAETKGELDQLREFAKSARTSETMNKILDEDGRTTDFLEGGSLIKQFDNNETLQELWPHAYKDITYEIMVEKQKYMRARPVQLAPDLTLAVPMPGHPAYPSGHATQTRFLARIFGYIDPKNAKAYEEMAFRVGQRREIAGLHYPSDKVAGKILADEVFDAEMKIPEFKKQIDEAKAEFQQENK